MNSPIPADTAAPDTTTGEDQWYELSNPTVALRWRLRDLLGDSVNADLVLQVLEQTGWQPPNGGGIRMRRCWVIECSECIRADGQIVDPGEHFDTLEDAWHALSNPDSDCGYSLQPDGRVLCEYCRADADHRALGHAFGGWKDPDELFPTTQWRQCNGCGRIEHRPVGADTGQEAP